MGTLPKSSQWLLGISPLPRTIQEALKLHGIQEVVGKGSNKTIMAWRDEINAAAGIDPNAQKVSGYADDDIPWCGLFVGYVVFKAGKPMVENPLWARNWAKFGTSVLEAGLGDVLVFQRPGGGGHVGFYVGEDSKAYHVLGGNQSNRTSITRIEKSRCIAKRRPPYRNMPITVRPCWLTLGGALSTNEA